MLSWFAIGSMSTILSNRWLQKRRPYWERLAKLLAQAGPGGLGQLTRAELQETALLYRQVASDLSTLRQDATARAYAEHVNQLLARAHHIIYSTRRTSFLDLLRYLRDGTRPSSSATCATCLSRCASLWPAALLGSVLTLARPQFMRTCSARRWWPPSSATRCGPIPSSAVAPVASSLIMTNNLSVCFTRLRRRHRLRPRSAVLHVF